MVRCPYNEVASFIYRYKGDKKNNETNILELGSGDGNNLWYFKKEGFNIDGIEIDEKRIQNAHERLKQEKLSVNIVKGSFVNIPFPDQNFDLVFDRAAVTTVNLEDAKKVISETHRILKKGGYFYFNPYSELDNSYFQGQLLEDGRIGQFTNQFSNYQGIQFYSMKEILNLFSKDLWELKELNLNTKRELISSRNLFLNTFEVIVRKR